MAQKTVDTSSFLIKSEWRCNYLADRDFYIAYGPTKGSHTVTFEWVDLGDVTITGAKIHATLGKPYGPLTGAEFKRVNGNDFDADGFASVVIDSRVTSLTATFEFKANGAVYEDYDLHESQLSFDDVYLLIEYEYNYTPPILVEYTDPDPIVGETYVKAVHMTELHTNVNLVRTAYGAEEYMFTSVIPGETSLGSWNDHVLEIRDAIDTLGATHDEWLELGDNCPRVDVLLQLRSVIQRVSEG